MADDLDELEDAEPQGPAPIIYRYRITFKDGKRTSVAAHLDPHTLALIREPVKRPPAWTKLTFRQCPNCPLEPEEHPTCPVAESLTDVVTAFPGRDAYEEVHVIVEGPQRTYAAHTSLATAAASLLGLYMPTSGCPVLGKLRPMVDMHLPFQTGEEAAARTIAMYLVAQHLLLLAGRPADWKLDGLDQMLREVGIVNKAFAERLAAVPEKNVPSEALGILSRLAHSPARSTKDRGLDRLAGVVTSFF